MKSRLPIAVSGLFLEQPHTGTGRYARHVIKYLSREQSFDMSIVADDRAAAMQALLEGSYDTRFRVVKAPAPALRAGSYARKLYWEQIGLTATAYRLRARVLYSPHFSAPVVCGCPTVISIHDVIPLTDPLYAETWQWQAYFRLVGLSARLAKAAITLSEYAKTEIVRVLGLPPERVHVVVPGVEAAFDPQPDAASSERARERYALPSRYLLYVGGADVRKNIGTLLEAVAGISASADVPALVIVARAPKSPMDTVTPDWRAQAVEHRLGDRVHFVERIEEEDLAAVYRGAEGFLFPSRAEGFGLTPLEAMACGVPVICSSATSLPEATGDAAILVPPDDVQGWATAIVRLAADAALRARLRTAGLERAAQFPWQNTGAGVAGVIRQVGACAY